MGSGGQSVGAGRHECPRHVGRRHVTGRTCLSLSPGGSPAFTGRSQYPKGKSQVKMKTTLFIYDRGSGVSRRAVQCAPAKTTRDATKLHSRMVTEYSNILYSRSSFWWMALVQSRLTYFRPSRMRPTTMATGATRAGSILRLGRSQ